MFSSKIVSLEHIVDVHPVSQRTLKKFAALQHLNAIKDMNSAQLQEFLTIYPIHLLPKPDTDTDTDNHFYVVGGFRQYEIWRCKSAQINRFPDANFPFKVNCLIHTSLSYKKLESMVLNDLIGGAIVFSLGKKPESQLDMLQQGHPEIMAAYLPDRRLSRAGKERANGDSK